MASRKEQRLREILEANAISLSALELRLFVMLAWDLTAGSDREGTLYVPSQEEPVLELDLHEGMEEAHVWIRRWNASFVFLRGAWWVTLPTTLDVFGRRFFFGHSRVDILSDEALTPEEHRKLAQDLFNAFQRTGWRWKTVS